MNLFVPYFKQDMKRIRRKVHCLDAKTCKPTILSGKKSLFKVPCLSD